MQQIGKYFSYSHELSNQFYIFFKIKWVFKYKYKFIIKLFIIKLTPLSSYTGGLTNNFINYSPNNNKNNDSNDVQIIDNSFSPRNNHQFTNNNKYPKDVVVHRFITTTGKLVL